MIDRDWPPQVALPAYRCLGHNYVTFHRFCDAVRLSLCRRGHSFRRNDTDMNVFCFAERSHAEQFQARFGGEFIDPKDRPKWPRPLTRRADRSLEHRQRNGRCENCAD